MGLSNALSTAVSGLVNHQKAMDNIGNNLANINTTGYKKGVFQFQTLLEQTLSGAMPADGGRGSVNAVTLGLGTQTGSINKVFTQGSLEASSDKNHMAIYGNGFFVLSTGNGYAYTRDGTFKLDGDNYLTSSSGLYVQGTMAVKNADGSVTIPQDSKLQNISIPIGSVGGMSATTTISYTGNLDSTKSLASGLKLYGTTSSPTVSNMQSWMPASFNNTDSSWSALENETYVVSQEVMNLAAANGIRLADGVSLAGNVTKYTSGTTPNAASSYSYYAIDPSSGKVVDVSTTNADGSVQPASYSDIFTAGLIPATQEVSTINGGNVQTSAAFGITVPAYLSAGDTVEYKGVSYTVNNSYTYPAWFYESNGGDFLSACNASDADFEAATWAPGFTGGWPNGFQGSELSPTATPSSLSGLPREGEQYPATLDTPLENLMYYNGSRWVQPFANISDGDEITLSFDKGNSTITATFTYNRPGTPAPTGNQQKVDIEQSYTLEHLLTFMAGDVDNTASACAAITPAMFGAPVSADNPDGDTSSPSFDRKAYEEALLNVSLAKSDSNTNTSQTGVMGLVDTAAQISAANGGNDDYDAPAETAGAFTREGASSVSYLRYQDGQLVSVTTEPSYNISIVSNLGSQNGISNINFTYNNVTSKGIFTAETEYAAAEGASAVTSAVVYDSLGNPKTVTVRLALVEQDSNFSTWRWYADCEDDTDFDWQVDDDGNIISSLSVGTGLIRFDSSGNFVSGSDYSETNGITIDLTDQGVSDPITVSIINGLNSSQKQDLDFSALTFSNESNSLTLESQNGYPPGALETYTVGTDGTIYGSYSNGASIPIARIVLATVPNETGLLAGGDNLYYTTPASGDAQYGYADVGGRGEVRQYWLETSNVDMSEEFTKLISVERGYQASSRVVTTADEMLQELLSMKR